MTEPRKAASEFEITGRMVFLSLIAFFVVVAGMNALMVTSAVRTFAGVETENAYKAGLAFNRDIAAAQEQDRRRWNVEVKRGADFADFTVTVRDAEGRAVAGLALEARLAHPTDRRLDRPLDVHPAGAGAFRIWTDASPGLWDLVIGLSRDGRAMFRSRSRITLG